MKRDITPPGAARPDARVGRDAQQSRRPLVLFFVLAFALPWLVWSTTIAEQHGLMNWHIPPSLAFWIGLPAAAYGAAALTGGRPAVIDLLTRMVRVRVPAASYAWAVLITPALAAATMGIALLTPNSPVSAAGTTAAALAGALVFNVFMWLITEETAWRGFALPRIQQRMNPLPASAVLGAAWAVWHLPLFFIAGSFQSGVPFVGFALSTVATSIAIGWLFNRSRGSVLIAALFHGVTDVTIAISGVMTSGAWPFWVFVGAQAVFSAAVAPSLSRMPRRV